MIKYCIVPQVGVLIGSYLFGSMSDKLGRKFSFFASVVIMAVFGVLSGVVYNYWAFIVLRCAIGKLIYNLWLNFKTIQVLTFR